MSTQQLKQDRAAQSARDKKTNAKKRKFSQAFKGQTQGGPPSKRQRRGGGSFLGATGRGGQLTGRGSTRNVATNRQEMVVEEDEYIAEVTVANQPNFNAVQYAVNPGQAGTFPWLSTIASRFEKYRFERLEFYYKREVSEFATDGQVGKVMMNFDTDASDPAPMTKQQLEDTVPHVDAMPCENMRLIIPVDSLTRDHDAHYVRPAGLPGAADIKTYDVGSLNVATQAILHNVVTGELHVRYRVCLMIPVLEDAAQAPTNYSASAFSTVTAGELITTTATPQVLAMATSVINGLGCVNTAGKVVPPAGTYLVTANVTSFYSATSNTFTATAVFKNGAALNALSSQYGNSQFNYVTAIATDVPTSNQVIVQCNGTDYLTLVQTNTFSGGTSTAYGTMTLVSL